MKYQAFITVNLTMPVSENLSSESLTLAYILDYCLSNSCNTDKFSNYSKVIDTLVWRDNELSTASGSAAIPHAMSESISNAIFCSCHFVTPFPWPSSFDSVPVQMVFIILTPGSRRHSKHIPYIPILQKVARATSNLIDSRKISSHRFISIVEEKIIKPNKSIIEDVIYNGLPSKSKNNIKNQKP